ncbi:peptidylprolyl isomerase [Pararhizobium mangrovi]|uniref:Parvulin-like PPIase n=1 Tax=Pararhizobium mangrovi TaxID=2590452 RepID=A0A506UCP0_9HYPH|nr:peptidylprolyl isomerase [Pararhizobium mangrovi]TPW31368.1 peptidylprolyl isomerase [Pararhizobium mangrovi]
MMDLMRRAAQTWAAKLLLIVLVLSFGVWGISGTVMNGIGGGDAVVKVGNIDVSSNEFRLAYRRDLAMLSQQFNTQLTPEQAKALGVEQRVYSQLASSATLDQLAENMDLGISQDELAKTIGSDPAFQDSSGNFSRQTFQSTLANAGMTQKDYIADQGHAAVRRQIVEALAGGMQPPVTLVNATLQHENATRDVEYLLVTKDMIDPIGDPSDKQLQSYYDAHKSDYQASEFRKIAYAALTPQTIADPGSVSEKQAREYYEQNADQYGTPERRTVEQLSFPDQKVAEAAKDKLDEGTSFEALAKEQGKSADDIKLGTFSRKDFPGKNLAEAAFSLKNAGDTSGVVKGAFGPVILKVTNIEAGNTKPFDQVEGEIRKQIATQNAGDRISDVLTSYQDDRAGGASLVEAAKKEGLKPVVVDAVNRQGETPKGKKLDLPKQGELLKAAFDNPQGEEIQPLNYGTAGYLWVEVLNVDKAHQRPLKEVRDQVASDWKAEQTDKAVAAKAKAIRKKITGDTTLKAVADELGVGLQTKQGIKRSGGDAVFGDAAVAAAFEGPQGLVAVAPAANPPEQIVLHVTGVHNGTQQGYDALPDQALTAMTNRMKNTVFGEMVTMLQKKYGVSINQQLGQQAIQQY